MASYTFTLPGTSKSFTIKGPDGFTEAQARTIFDQQAAAGSFVGFKPGDALSAAKQAAAGLPGAASQLAQSLTGTTSIINGSVLNNSVGQIAGQASQAASQAVSVAKQAVSTVTGVLSKVPVTNGINTADFAKQAPALTSVGSLSSVDVRSGLAQASKLVGQPADKITDTAGVGKFGFDATQLEAAGVLKPGVAAQYLQSGANSLTSVLKSPTVFTGKDGIKSLTDLLGSESKQNGIQQNLMAQGLSGLKQVGIPTDSLNPSALTGTVLNAAKSLPNTVNWAKGLPLPPGVKTAFDTVARDSAFAVDFANQKVDNSLKQEIVPVPASDTVNRETLNAAASRVVGNAKVPTVDYNGVPEINVNKFGNDYSAFKLESTKLQAKLSETLNSRTIESTANSIRQREQIIGDFNALDARALELIRQAKAIETRYGATLSQQISTLESERELFSKLIGSIEAGITALKQKLENSTA